MEDNFVGIDIFAGAGGMSLGFRDAGFVVAAAVERDPVHAAVHAANFPDTTVVIGDVGSLSAQEIRWAAGLSRYDEIHCLFGGPPCQGFSWGGKQDPSDPRNSGVLEFANIVVSLRPLYFVLENVDGLLASYSYETMSAFLGTIAAAHYDVVSPIQALDASDFGVPQWRRRVFILGYRRDLPPPIYPTPLPESVTVHEALGDLPALETMPALYGCNEVVCALGSPSPYSLSLRDPEQQPRSYRLTGLQLSRHAPIVRERFKATAPGGKEPVSRFFRLDPSGFAPTLRAGTDVLHGSFTAPRPIHHEEARCITVREAARLHSFPDWFRFNPTIWHGFREVGNAVPPRLARAVARQILAALGGRSRQSEIRRSASAARIVRRPIKLH